ncbi:MAG: hypothetical protein F7B17_09475, partial [Desulfurococcales archaeon]|nr:hypothetical protein [Desulfurococcales archaeon]
IYAYPSPPFRIPVMVDGPGAAMYNSPRSLINLTPTSRGAPKHPSPTQQGIIYKPYAVNPTGQKTKGNPITWKNSSKTNVVIPGKG